MTVLKVCRKCNLEKEEESFPKLSSKKKIGQRSVFCRKCADAQKSRGKKARQENKANGDGGNYLSRWKWLQLIGFENYQEYLKSDLWKQIRARVFQIKGDSCYLCGKKANQVHHNRYHRNDLVGKKIRFLNPICGPCHEQIEFIEGKKVSLSSARKSFRKLRKNRVSGKQ